MIEGSSSPPTPWSIRRYIPHVLPRKQAVRSTEGADGTYPSPPNLEPLHSTMNPTQKQHPWHRTGLKDGITMLAWGGNDR